MDPIEEIYQAYKKDVLNFLIYFMKTSDVDDVFQETFTNALKAINQNISVKNIRAWLIAIARNAAIDYMRRQTKSRGEAIAFQDDYIDSRQPSIEEKIQIKESEKALLKSIHELKRNHQEVVILRGIKEFSVSETAEILNWSENKVKVTFHRAIKKLSSILDQGGDVYESK